jgi:L,D-transpeptidase ErfK/SrfK
MNIHPPIVIAAAGFALAIGIEPLRALEQGHGLFGSVRSYTVVRGDTATSVGARFGVSPEVIISDNHLPAGGALSVGQTLQLDARHVIPNSAAAGIVVVNVPQRMLFYAADAGGVTAFPVAVGRRTWPTPLADLSIVVKERNPTWDVPVSILEEARRAGREQAPHVPPGPNNPLGKFWLGLSGGGIGIHGTNAPASIYRAATHGCVRLHPDDIEWLFPRVGVGTAVRLIYEPILLTSVGGQVFLEVHPDVYRRVPDAAAAARALAEAAGVSHLVDWDLAGRAIAARHGVARDVTARPF